jgi:hypothetical protein
MDKGILRFVAEAYLLLHAGMIAEAELAAETALVTGAKAEKAALTHEHGGSTHVGEQPSRLLPGTRKVGGR